MAEDETAQRSMLDEALKKGALVWLQVGSERGHARWYAWADAGIYVLTGTGEQPDPGLAAGQAVRVVVRSKDNRHRIIAFDADVSRLTAADPDWDPATAELVRQRLNLTNAEAAPQRWAGPGYALYRLTPRLPLAETPDAAPDGGRREQPVPSSATTVDRVPWVLHRRGGSGRRLS